VRRALEYQQKEKNINMVKLGIIILSVLHILAICLIIYGNYSDLKKYPDMFSTFGNRAYFPFILSAFLVLLNLGAFIGFITRRSFGIWLSSTYFFYEAITSILRTLYSLNEMINIGEFDYFTFVYTGFIKYAFLSVLSAAVVFFLVMKPNKNNKRVLIKKSSIFLVIGVAITVLEFLLSVIMNID